MPKKLLVIAGIVAAVAFAKNRNKATDNKAELWREATAPRPVNPSTTSSNGSSPATTSKDAVSEN